MGSRIDIRTVPELFIIESLQLDDEETRSQEGEILAHMLRLSGKQKTKYFYIRTERELDEIIDLFDESLFRYLHISCHANQNGMATTFDNISYVELGRKLEPCLKGRRVFVSACEMANRVLASSLLRETGCFSLIGPANSINFDDAAAFWISFYHLMFKINEKSMKRADIQFYVNKLSSLFGEPINYFVSDDRAPGGVRRIRQRKAANKT